MLTPHIYNDFSPSLFLTGISIKTNCRFIKLVEWAQTYAINPTDWVKNVFVHFKIRFLTLSLIRNPFIYVNGTPNYKWKVYLKHVGIQRKGSIYVLFYHLQQKSKRLLCLYIAVETK